MSKDDAEPRSPMQGTAGSDLTPSWLPKGRTGRGLWRWGLEPGGHRMGPDRVTWRSILLRWVGPGWRAGVVLTVAACGFTSGLLAVGAACAKEPPGFRPLALLSAFWFPGSVSRLMRERGTFYGWSLLRPYEQKPSTQNGRGWSCSVCWGLGRDAD